MIKMVRDCKPNGRRSFGLPKLRWKDTLVQRNAKKITGRRRRRRRRRR